MSTSPLFPVSDFPDSAISPMRELGAYEALWAEPGMTVRHMADLFRAHPEALPSDLVDRERVDEMAEWVLRHFEERGVRDFGIRVNRGGEYPRKLRDARHPVEVLTYQGEWSWTESPTIAVVGTRRPTDAGVARARKLVRSLAEDGFTIVSGLAAGIDTVAHTTALELGVPTIAVLGTPLSATYPRENRALQVTLAEKFCVVTQVPAYRYHQQDYRSNRSFFPERNATMSALTEATVIVEAGATSGTLTQARAALAQGRRLFILASCFDTPGLTWPQRFEAEGAVRVEDYAQIQAALPPSAIHP